MAYGFFLGPICKAPEHVRFLVEDAKEPVFSEAVEVDIEEAACKCRREILAGKRGQRQSLVELFQPL